MSGLSADTEYEVQASLDSAFEETLSATFTTLRYPSLSGIDVTDITTDHGHCGARHSGP